MLFAVRLATTSAGEKMASCSCLPAKFGYDAAGILRIYSRTRGADQPDIAAQRTNAQKLLVVPIGRECDLVQICVGSRGVRSGIQPTCTGSLDRHG